MKNKQDVSIDGYEGTWYAIAEDVYHGEPIYLMESCELGDEVPAIIIDKDNKVVHGCDDIRNGFNDFREAVESQFGDALTLPYSLKYFQFEFTCEGCGKFTFGCANNKESMVSFNCPECDRWYEIDKKYFFAHLK